MERENGTVEGLRDLGSGIWQAIERLETICDSEKPHGVAGLASGIDALDAELGGFFDGDFVVIGGRPGSFKTPLAMTMFLAMAMAEGSNRAPMFFTLDASRDGFFCRVIAQLCSVAINAVKRGLLQGDNWEAVAGGMARFFEERHAGEYVARVFDDAFSIDEFRVVLDRECSKGIRPSCVFVDYMQLVRPVTRGIMSRADEIADTSRELKLLAKQYECPVIAISQLNRHVDRDGLSRPKLTDLRGSGSLEDDADVVLLLRRMEAVGDDMALETLEINVAKHKDGRAGRVLPVTIDVESGRIISQ